MRFVAWRGRSAGYRQAVEGHSPWAPTNRNPQPVYLQDIERSDLPEELKQTVRAEGIAAVAFIPMQSGRLLGKFMAYYDAPQDFARGNRRGDDACAPARLRPGSLKPKVGRPPSAAQQLAAIVESPTTRSSARASMVSSPPGTGRRAPFGYTAAEAIGQPVTMLIPPTVDDEEPEILRVSPGERVDHFETIRRRKDGSLLDISLTVSPVRDGRGASSAPRRSPATSPIARKPKRSCGRASSG